MASTTLGPAELASAGFTHPGVAPRDRTRMILLGHGWSWACLRTLGLHSAAAAANERAQRA